ncbi:hypothetical protein KR009_000148 [Drosophila setifemur]|nr:hypothetical protein KR009_000148 [Drosophila setifemur]
MDVAKLEKMKVVDLRNELQSRGLDTKGIKAVLIERLRAHVEGGAGDGDGAPVTPSRRQRRTRSMSRSPSPIPTAPVAAEPVLDTLEEEDQPTEQPVCEAQPTSDPETEQEPELEPKPELESDPEPKPELNVLEEEIVEDDVDSQLASDEQSPQDDEARDNNKDDIDKETAVGMQQNASEPMDEGTLGAREGENQQEDVIENADDSQANGNNQKMEVDDESVAVAPKADEDAELDVKSEDQPNERRKRSHSRTRSCSRSGSRSPKHHSSVGDKRDKAAAEERTVPEDEPINEENKVGLSWLDSDLHLRIDPTTFASAKPLSSEIYSLTWAGARTNFGVRDGKVCFEVRLTEESLPENLHHFRDEPHVRGFRVGFSTPQSSLLLGEAEHSFAYCETGRKANQGEFSAYGKPYQLDDVIGCYLDLESQPCTIKYTLNGEDLGEAFNFEKSTLGEEGVLFPHIVTKGYEYSTNFSDSEQLLVNAERPTRKRRKPHKDEEKEDDKDDNDIEKWKVLDEATADDDEVEKKEIEGKSVQPAEGMEMSENANVAGVTQKAEAQVEVETKDSSEGIEQQSEACESSETAKISSDVSGGTKSVANGNATVEKSGEEETSKEPSAANDEEDDGPSPNKRPKKDADVEKADLQKEKENENEKSQVTEDEYEDVVPEPRETAALLESYVLIGLLRVEQLVPGPQRAASRKECEVILLVGLPGAGKTHWTLKHMAENPDKRFEVIGPDSLIAKMTIDGSSRKTVHKGRWDKVYETCLNSLGALEDIAMKRRRNFILDQTNVYASAQRRKMKGFNDFKRIAVVCIPSEDELKRRIAEKEEKGNAFTVKDSTINNLRANFTLPSLEFGWFDDINYTELTGDEAKSEVKKYNEKGKKAIDADRSRDKRSRGGRDNYRRDERNRNRYNEDRRREYGGQRHDSRWSDARRGGGGGGGGYSSNSAGGGGSRGYDSRRNYSSGGGQNWMQNSRRSGYDDRGYGGGSGGGGSRGYDNRNRGYSGGGGGGGGGGSGSQQNWMQGNRRSGYDDRSYGSSRDYRDRDRGNERSRMGSNDRNRGSSQSSYRSGGGAHQQRDFRPGHRDTKEDSRGGYERSVGQSLPKYGTNSAAGYDQYKQQAGGAAGGGKSSLSGKWSTYTQHQQQAQQHQQTGVWQTQQQSQQYQQQQQQTSGQQPYWGYNQMQGYGNQQAWQGGDPQQQQQHWMSWWQQQQGGAAAGNASSGASVNVGGAAGNNDGGATNHYWSQYSYSTQSNTAPDKK